MNDTFISTYDNLVEGPAMFVGLIGIIVLIYSIAIIFALVFKIISRWIFFKKCGEEGWKALIPIYTDITLIKISGLNILWIFLLYIGTVISISRYVLNLLNNEGTFGIPIIIISILTLFHFPTYLISLFAKFNLSYNLSKKFNQGAGYAVLLFFFQPIMFFVFGLSKSLEYNEDIEVSGNGVFGTTDNSSKSNNQFCKDCGSKLSKGDMYCQNCGTKVR